MTTIKNVKIIECGNGFPDVGDYVPGHGEIYRVVRLAGQIRTGSRPGEGNWCLADVDEADWDDCDDGDEFPARVDLTE